MDWVIIRPGELALKGRNRSHFERLLLQNLRTQLRAVAGVPVEKRWGRFYAGPTDRAEVLAREAARVFGVSSTSPALRIEPDLDAIGREAVSLVATQLERRSGDAEVPFRVTASRSDKTFPFNSTDVQRRLGAVLGESFPRLRVDLSNAVLDVGVEIRDEGAFLFVEKLRGAGGLPAGVEGRVLNLLSGGIDSPVAAWLMMKRGCRVDHLHFDSQPFTGPGSLAKVRALTERLGRLQGNARLFVVPFAEIQVALKDIAKPGYRTLLYRRFMLRIAARIAKRAKALAIVTGDSVGQVASQTLTNLGVVAEACHDYPVLRPLVGADKQETIDLARRIGTYEISIRPFEDCCTLFQPDRPVTAGRVRDVVAIEADLDVDGLVAAAVARVD